MIRSWGYCPRSIKSFLTLYDSISKLLITSGNTTVPITPLISNCLLHVLAVPLESLPTTHNQDRWEELVFTPSSNPRWASQLGHFKLVLPFLAHALFPNCRDPFSVGS